MALGGDLLGDPPWRSVTQARTGRGEGGASFKNKAKEVSGEKIGAAEMVFPGLVAASQFAFEQKSRCGVTIRREKAPGTCEQPGLQPTGGKRKGESSVRTEPHRGGGSGLGPTRLGGWGPSFPEEREGGGPVPVQPQQQSEPGRKGAWHKEPSLGSPGPTGPLPYNP